MKKNKRFSFTLVEAVIVSALFSLVGLAVLSTFISGSKIWKRVYQQDRKAEVSIFFETFTKDVMNTLALHDVAFFGSETFVQFPSIIAYPAEFGPIKEGEGQVGYAFFLNDGVIRRTTRTVSDMYKSNPGTATAVLDGVTDCSFSYYFFDTESNSYLWLNEWTNNFLPAAISVRVSVRYGESVVSFNKKIFIPVENVNTVKEKQL